MASELPDDFLSEPAENLTASKVDFTQTQLPEHAMCYACVIDNALTPSECRILIDAAEARASASSSGAWGRATVNVGQGHQALYEENRKCGRVIWPSQDLADRFWKRIEALPEVQEILRLEERPRVTGFGPYKRKEVWKLSRANDYLRFLKYEGGGYFRPHCDADYATEDGREKAYFTLHIYLNDAGEFAASSLPSLSISASSSSVVSCLIGGATTFHGMDMKRRFDVVPKAGRILLFQHRDLMHSGDDVVQGKKFTIRTDLMYAKEN
ncbi:oxidoreductase domain-containing protein [Xylariaceae sp. FL0016]|nr:oxidoreductase domain-containing protein [Xylariaceae sp. FL0016]